MKKPIRKPANRRCVHSGRQRKDAEWIRILEEFVMPGALACLRRKLNPKA